MEEGKKKKVESESESEFETLPFDIIIEHILLRLPLKPVTRFKCVSKPWQSAISTHEFAKSHLQSHSPDSSPSSQFILFPSKPRHDPFPPYTAVTLDEHGRVQDSLSLDFYKSYQHLGHLVGSCNGLLCFKKHIFKYYVCNPVAHNCNDTIIIDIPAVCANAVTLVPFEMGFTYSFDGYMIFASGFGYASSIDDYKIVCFLVDSQHGKYGLSHWSYEALDGVITSGDIKLVISVYAFSLRTSTWDVLCGADQLDGAGIGSCDQTLFLNDKLYWYAPNTNRVVAVDFVNGDVNQITTPLQFDNGIPPFKKRAELCKAKGRLLFRCAQQVWGLNEDGLGWTKLYDLNCDGLNLLCFSETTGRWLVANNGTIGLLDPSNPYETQYQGDNALGDVVLSAVDFKPSLLLPKHLSNAHV